MGLTHSMRRADDLDALLGEIEDEGRRAAAAEGALAEGPRRRAGSRCLAFEMGRSVYAAPLEQVVEVQRAPAVALLPGLPRWILGVANLRGDVLSVVDLQDFFGLAATDSGAATTRMLVARTRSGDMTVGFTVDRVAGVQRFDLEGLQPAGGAVDPRIAPYVLGVHVEEGRCVVLVDLEAVLQCREMRQFQEA